MRKKEHSATSAAQENNAVRRLNVLRRVSRQRKWWASLSSFCLKPNEQPIHWWLHACHGYCWTAAYASGQCSLDDPSSISTKSVAAEGCVKDYLELLTVWVLRKIKGGREDWLRKARHTKSMTGMGYSKMVPLVSRQKHFLTNTWSVMSFSLHQTRVESL